FDAVGNLIKLRKGDQSEPPLRAYAYDKLGRLTETRDGTTNALLQGYTYDATGNRTSKTDAGATQTYTYPTSNHRLSQVGVTARTYDATGNTTAVGGTTQEYAYTAANRMGQVKQGGNAVMNYAYNGRGEQTRRYPTTTSTAQTYASYDEAGHTVGIYDHAGNRIQEVIWLGDLPIGVLDASKLHYVQADHLGTPRNVIDPVAEKSVWAWQLGNEAFGDSTPNQDPDNNGTTFVFDLRFPGQLHDAASGLNYNYYRDYDPVSGRYARTDPIGLVGGIALYGYVYSDPLSYLDSTGLAPDCRIETEYDGGYGLTGETRNRLIGAVEERRICIPVPGMSDPDPTDIIPDMKRWRARKTPFGMPLEFGAYCWHRFTQRYNVERRRVMRIVNFEVCRECGQVVSKTFVNEYFAEKWEHVRFEERKWSSSRYYSY
ncbi:RHS repeat-associated core domain-containing protein, partial [Lysobacter sp. Root983]|uniref:RHS repeat-associated core domain-containing protein n=1 Tax=Lysobacter sp. Root983 TaxID=1736613 RepID=UPI000A489BA0